MDHLNWDDVWSYLDGEWTISDERALHLQKCPCCQTRVEEARTAHGQIVEALVTPVPPQTEASFAQVRQRLTAANVGAWAVRRARSGYRNRLVAGSVAAVVPSVAGLAGFWQWQPHGADGRMTAASTSSATGPQAAPANTNRTAATVNGVSTNFSAANAGASQSAASGDSPPVGQNLTMQTAAMLSGQSVGATALAASAAGSGKANGSIEQKGWTPANKSASTAGWSFHSPAPTPNNVAEVPMVSNSVVSGQVTVEVRDSQDRPIANAQVALIWSGKVQATGKTDATGQTESIHVTLPANPLFYNMPTVDFPPVGTLTVVVWKNGYVPQVDFEGTVFAYGSSQVVDVTLPQAKAPAEDAVGMTGSGVNPDSSPATRAAWADGVHWLLSSASAMDGVIAAGTPLSLSVVDLQGRPVAGAQVVWLVNGVIEGRTVTGTDGQAVCRASGFPDWRTVDGSQVLGLMVSKDGYAPAVTLEVRVPPTGLQPWTVHLSPLAGATGVPTQAVPAAVVTESQAEQLYHLALDTNQGG